MDSCRSCKNCKKSSVIYDDKTSYLVCTSCGVVQGFEDYQANLGGFDGQEGTYVRMGTSGTGSFLQYKEKKIFEAQKLINDVTDSLGFSAAKTNEVKSMVGKISEGQYGQGDWFLVLVGACSYVVMRKESKPLSIAEVAYQIDCDVHELGRMVARVVVHMNLKLPDFNIVHLYERSVWNIPTLSRASAETVSRIIKQGTFLIQCAVKWFLTTGRRPVPVVVAVLVLVSNMNQVGLDIEEVSQKLNANVKTSRLRYKELLESLVDVSKSLPWGKDINTKNMLKHAPQVIQYMEMKSMSKPTVETTQDSGFCMESAIDESLVSEIVCASDDMEENNKDNNCSNSNVCFSSVTDLKTLKASQDFLCGRYMDFLRDVSTCKQHRRVMNRYEATEQMWNGKSDLCEKLLLDEILEKDVGLDALPPSFKANCMANQRRREKVDAAKKRIHQVMDPCSHEKKIHQIMDPCSHGKKKRRHVDRSCLDWEDYIIESLLLHHVNEVEIEKGHYKALIDLNLFNSPTLT